MAVASSLINSTSSVLISSLFIHFPVLSPHCPPHIAANRTVWGFFFQFAHIVISSLSLVLITIQ